MFSRRHAFRSLSALVAGSPLFAQQQGNRPAPPPATDPNDDLMGPINVHEFEEVAKRKLHKMAYDFIAGGVEEEYTLRANREAYGRVYLLPRVMIDVSNIDTSLELFGAKHEFPIVIAPTGGKNLVLPSADEVVAQGALATKTAICSSTGVQKLLEEGKPLHWWSNTTGTRTKEQAIGYCKRIEDSGGKGVVLTVDNAYQSNRDRNNRNRFDYGYMQSGVPQAGGPARQPRNPARPAMWQPHTPSLTWEWIDWARGGGVKIPILVKGVLHPLDAELAVQRGASAVVVSNHGGRQLDGAVATLDALPDCVDAVGGKIPVLMDGGIRRGQDILKALALGAKGVLVGRAPLWGLAAAGQPGVERVLWMLGAELKLAMALAGVTKLGDINRKLVKRLPA
jgi:isopentenyl diphosphate isomerase/L-lactate dehydrogenase-like FMN-dependent dehydrogenase